MQFIVAFEARANLTEQILDRANSVFRNWKPAAGVRYTQMFGRVDNRGGFMVVETDDPKALARDAATFTPFMACGIFPVLELADYAQIGMEVEAFRHTIL